MQTGEALTALTALAHPTRLDAYRMLIRAEPGGLSTGQMVEATGLGQSTFSSQLAILVAAGLVVPEKRGRQMIHRADIGRLRELMLFLAKDCCGGRDERCAPFVAQQYGRGLCRGRR